MTKKYMKIIETDEDEMILLGHGHLLKKLNEEFMIKRKDLNRLGKLCECTIDNTDDFICPCRDFKNTGNCICNIWKKKVKND